MSQRERIRMTHAEVRKFLAEHRKAQVATIGRDGTPHLTTLFYGLIEGQIAFWTYRRSQKAVNLHRDPRLTVLVEDGRDYDELRGVMIHGLARIVDGTDEVRSLALELTGQGRPLDDATRAVIDAQAPKRVVVVVQPQRVVSWDHGKLGET